MTQKVTMEYVAVFSTRLGDDILSFF